MSAANARSSPNQHLAHAFHAAITDSPLQVIRATDPMQTQSEDVTPKQRCERLFEWAERVVQKGAPEILVQDCVDYLLAVSTAKDEVGSAGQRSPYRAATSSSNSAYHSNVQPTPKHSSTEEHKSKGTGTAVKPVEVDTKLDQDHCTMSCLLEAQEKQWKSWIGDNRVGSPSELAAAGLRAGLPPLSEEVNFESYDDVFSDEFSKREKWLCWASVLREVKTEAAVQQQLRHPREVGSSRPGFEGLLEYLEVPEVKWLLEDRPSTVLMASDIFMQSREYAIGRDAARWGPHDEEEFYYPSSGRDENVPDGTDRRKRRSTNDMAALHKYLTHPEHAEDPPLRSLLQLTLSTHIDGAETSDFPPQ